MRLATRLGGAAVLACSLVTADAARAATITIINADGPGVGFNDNTAVAPIGGNPGTTLGEQRLNAFARAAALWADRLESTDTGGQDVAIEVLANFEPILDGGGQPLCNMSGGVLGAAGPDWIERNFPGSISDTWYHGALVNHIAQTDRAPSDAEISATFNADVDELFCLGDTDWYYGYDGLSGGDIDLVSVVLHEIGHGLGFSTFVTLGTGEKFFGSDDVYMRWLENHVSGELYPTMTDQERFVTSQSPGDLHWTGPAVTQFVADNSALLFGDFLTDGFDPSSNHMEMYAPAQQQPGSSVSHYTNDTSPNQIMEPALSQPIHNLELTLALMSDIGWTGIIECGDADRNGIRAATDALIALQTSVGANACLESLCDPNGSGTITATDALIMLQGGTGQDVTYDCGLAGT